ncbi:MAG: chemotaxis protein CheW [Desulfobacterales bacterium]|nr:chemotaxis protein CheW [Desulfobacterales bacterium]MDD4071384.1 chemotaxis protein CheW [Desulfobacterales bacterium]MDD4391429.1 chemotaxis protein CheW [Desulfobacterales bacterium]
MVEAQYVVFSINEQIFGIEISKIKEVLSYRKITPLPHVQGFVKGIINLRGMILPVFDLGKKFNFVRGDYSPYHVIIVMEISGRVMGVIVDEITDVVEIFSEELQTTENLPTTLRRDYLNGVGKKNDEMIILLNIDRLLSPEELELADAT